MPHMLPNILAFVQNMSYPKAGKPMTTVQDYISKLVSG